MDLAIRLCVFLAVDHFEFCIFLRSYMNNHTIYYLLFVFFSVKNVINEVLSLTELAYYAAQYYARAKTEP